MWSWIREVIELALQHCHVPTHQDGRRHTATFVTATRGPLSRSAKSKSREQTLHRRTVERWQGTNVQAAASPQRKCHGGRHAAYRWRPGARRDFMECVPCGQANHTSSQTTMRTRIVHGGSWYWICDRKSTGNVRRYVLFSFQIEVEIRADMRIWYSVCMEILQLGRGKRRDGHTRDVPMVPISETG